MIKEFHEAQFQFFRNEFSLKCELFPCSVRKNIIVNLTPEAIVSLKDMADCFDNYYIAQDLKQYRPQRKPITKSQIKGLSKELVKSEKFKRKRRNIVRDWLYFIVWFVRLRRILEHHKLASSPTALLDLIQSKRKKSHLNTVLKSPLQDATQLTYTNFGFGLPNVQIRVFEDTKKLEEFYTIGPQNQKQKVVQRIAPLSINISRALLVTTLNNLLLDYTKNLVIKGVDFYLTKVTAQR